jgi:ribulose-phosphate 3-epimerase
MKISASIYSNKERLLEDLVRELEGCGVDLAHVDCNDDLGVEDSIARIRQVSSLPIDLHIISDDPAKFYPMIARHGVEYVTFQHENLKGRLPEFPALGCQYGLAITTDTPNEVFDQYAAHCDFILFMTTTPGQSGGTFHSANFRKIRDFRRAYPGKRIHVDGGVNAEISFVLRNLGVYSAVSGSFLVNAGSLPQAFLQLLVQKRQVNHLHVRDVMHQLDELPILNRADLTLPALLRKIEDLQMGYCLITDDQGRLSGLVTNADLRRGLLRHHDRLADLDAQEMVNPQPKTIADTATIGEMLAAVSAFPFIVQFLPVVDADQRLVGAVNFNNLILGEL